mmetsp:Transcript_4540/g.11717  ORF Transcript_4540/g.11717 Transcript_4540/m.11717 type:complete len:289 (+) Transcript_4540:1362-2228(+)
MSVVVFVMLPRLTLGLWMLLPWMDSKELSPGRWLFVLGCFLMVACGQVESGIESSSSAEDLSLFSVRFPLFLVVDFLWLLLLPSSFDPVVLTVSVVCSLLPKAPKPSWFWMSSATNNESVLLFFRLTFFLPVASLLDLALCECRGKVLLCVEESTSLASVTLPSFSDSPFFFFFFFSFLSFDPILIDADRAGGLSLRLRLLEDFSSFATVFFRASVARVFLSAKVELTDFVRLLFCLKLEPCVGKLLLLLLLFALVSNFVCVCDMIGAVLLLMAMLVCSKTIIVLDCY